MDVIVKGVCKKTYYNYLNDYVDTVYTLYYDRCLKGSLKILPINLILKYQDDRCLKGRMKTLPINSILNYQAVMYSGTNRQSSICCTN